MWQLSYRLAQLGLLAVLVTYSFADAQRNEEPAMPDNEQIIRQFIAAWSGLDAAELSQYFSEDGTYYNMPTAPVTGRSNIQSFIAGFIRNWQSTDWEIVSLFSAGNLVVAERVDRTVVAGKPVDLPATGIFEMENGKIKVWRDYFDLATYTNALTNALNNN